MRTCRSRAVSGSRPANECASSRGPIGKDGDGLESENVGVSSMKEGKEARLVANVSCDVIILRLCAAECDLVPCVIAPAEGTTGRYLVLRPRFENERKCGVRYFFERRRRLHLQGCIDPAVRWERRRQRTGEESRGGILEFAQDERKIRTVTDLFWFFWDRFSCPRGTCAIISTARNIITTPVAWR